MPELNDKVSVTLGKRTITGNVIGIDYYHLENFDGAQHRWPSYTIVSEDTGLFKRYWVTDWGRTGWFLWTTCKKKMTLKNQSIVTDRSGIAKIEFTGEQGVSTPMAALTVLKLPDGKLYGLERFTGSQVLFFHAQKIGKPKFSVD